MRRHHMTKRLRECPRSPSLWLPLRHQARRVADSTQMNRQSRRPHPPESGRTTAVCPSTGRGRCRSTCWMHTRRWARPARCTSLARHEAGLSRVVMPGSATFTCADGAVVRGLSACGGASAHVHAVETEMASYSCAGSALMPVAGAARGAVHVVLRRGDRRHAQPLRRAAPGRAGGARRGHPGGAAGGGR